MRDPEFIELRNKFLITLLVVSIFAALLIVFIYRLSGVSNSNIYTKVRNKENMVVLVVDSDCKKCAAVRDVLDENEVKYYLLDRYRDKYIKTIYSRIGLDDEINSPCLLKIKKGKLVSYLDSISDKTILEDYINDELK